MIVGALIGRQFVDRSGVPDEPISAEDWEMMIQTAQKIRPGMARQEIITTLCSAFGPRAPYCVDMQPPLPNGQKFPPGHRDHRDEVDSPMIPTWALVAAIGAFAFFILK